VVGGWLQSPAEAGRLEGLIKATLQEIGHDTDRVLTVLPL
jgi:hypothetical protein